LRSDAETFSCITFNAPVLEQFELITKKILPLRGDRPQVGRGV